MTSIGGPSSPTPPSLLPQTSDTQPDTSTIAPDVPFFENLGFARLTAATLGLGLPQSPGDTEAILSEVSQQLQQTVDQLRSQRDQSIADAVEAAQTGILATLQALSTTGERLIDEKAQLAQQQTKLENEQTQLAQDQQTLSAAQGANATAVSAFNFWDNQVKTIDQSKDPSGYANAVTQRAAASQNVATTQAAVNGAQAAVNSDIAAIAQTEAAIATLQASIDQDTGIYNALQAGLVTILNLATQATNTRTTATAVNTASDLGRDQVLLREFDKIFQGLSDIGKSLDATNLQRAFDQRQLVDKDTVERLALAVLGLLPGAALPSSFDIGQSAFSNAGGSRLKIPL